ncbi:hypothetical protein F8M41_007516 [Gigaspora margarita]|uniref:Uncharacterized protein n=1 Tax=Gigaspora margarita TaxID=4874 RepID=A0A8H4AW63_GIGMA|nr:hypothetical protein F8M41_007516 [Gigaspora margarita]
MNSKNSRILMKEIPPVTYLPGEYERYCEIFATMQNKDGGQFFQYGAPLYRQSAFVHKTLKELSKKENDPKILRAAYDCCFNQHEQKNKTTTNINNVYIKTEVECSGTQNKKELNKNEPTKTTCLRNNLLRKISFFIMIFIIIGLFLYVSVI